jgi:Uncharacterized protein conserved in bacteria (DUF2059)
MRKMLSLGVAVLTGGLLAAGVVPASAQEQPANPAVTASTRNEALRERMATAGQLLELSHTRATLEHWGHMIRVADLASECDCADPEDLGRLTAVWQSAVDRLFDGQRIFDRLQVAIATKFSDAELARMLAFHTSALGRKVNDAMKPPAVSSLDEAAEEKALKAAEKQLKSDPARRAVISEIVKVSGGAKLVVSSLLNIAAGTSIGMASAKSPGQPRPDVEQILEAIEGSRPIMEATLAGVIPAAYQQMLKPLSVKDLKAYRDELATPLAMALRDEVMAVIDREVRVQTVAIGSSVAKELTATRL